MCFLKVLNFRADVITRSSCQESMGTWVGIPDTHVQCLYASVPVTQCWGGDGGGRGKDPWGSLANSMSSRFRERLCLKKPTKICGLIEEDTQCHPLASTSTDVYVPFCTHAHIHTTHTYTSSKFHVRKKTLISFNVLDNHVTIYYFHRISLLVYFLWLELAEMAHSHIKVLGPLLVELSGKD